MIDVTDEAKFEQWVALPPSDLRTLEEYLYDLENPPAANASGEFVFPKVMTGQLHASGFGYGVSAIAPANACCSYLPTPVLRRVSTLAIGPGEDERLEYVREADELP